MAWRSTFGSSYIRNGRRSGFAGRRRPRSQSRTGLSARLLRCALLERYISVYYRWGRDDRFLSLSDYMVVARRRPRYSDECASLSNAPHSEHAEGNCCLTPYRRVKTSWREFSSSGHVCDGAGRVVWPVRACINLRWRLLRVQYTCAGRSMEVAPSCWRQFGAIGNRLRSYMLRIIEAIS